jgi:diguanylate cyclase (GGDEF)-like protein
MQTLYHALIAQHSRQLTPINCTEQIASQLQRYLGEVILDNKLSSALVVELYPLSKERPPTELAHIKDIVNTARYAFFFTMPDDAINLLQKENQPVLLKQAANSNTQERFIAIADGRFSALLTSIKVPDQPYWNTVWSFEPDVVYTALDYLKARVQAEIPIQAELFSEAIKNCTPKATTLQLTVSVTSKLTRLLQEQMEREIAINSILKFIRSSSDLEKVLQVAVEIIGKTLNVEACAIRINANSDNPSYIQFYFQSKELSKEFKELIVGELDSYSLIEEDNSAPYLISAGQGNKADTKHALAILPIVSNERTGGALLVLSNNPNRIWDDRDLLLLGTIADQVAMVIDNKRLVVQAKKLSLTDEFTGCYNHWFMEKQLERDLALAIRMDQPLSLVLIAVDQLRIVTDKFGHDLGDKILRKIAHLIGETLRGGDTVSLYNGKEFALVLPYCPLAGAVSVAERLRESVEQMRFSTVGRITTSIGVATSPLHGSSRHSMINKADAALREAMDLGGNRVNFASDEDDLNVDNETETATASLSTTEAIPG